MRFENINELGEIKSIDKDPSLFRFEYTNTFYGSCSFLAKVIEGEHRPLYVDEGSISLQSFTLKRGSSSILLSAAKIFFTRMLGKYTHVRQLENDPAYQ